MSGAFAAYLITIPFGCSELLYSTGRRVWVWVRIKVRVPLSPLTHTLLVKQMFDFSLFHLFCRFALRILRTTNKYMGIIQYFVLGCFDSSSNAIHRYATFTSFFTYKRICEHFQLKRARAYFPLFFYTLSVGCHM